MIVQPDFVDHFKTKALVKLTKDESAPLAVLRLWGHCQTSRRWQFPNMTPEQLAALCAWGDRKPACHTAMIKAGYLKRLPEGGFEAHQWDEQNGSLIQKWRVGKLGGRPKKGGEIGPKNNRAKTERLTVENRTKTDQIRSDQRREDRNVPTGNSVGVGEIQEGGDATSRNLSPEDGVTALVVPEFEPLPDGMFRRELEPMLKEAKRARAKVEACESSCVWHEQERPNFAEDVAWYENEIGCEATNDERRERLKRELEKLRSSRMVRVQGPLKAEAAKVIRAWSVRIGEIEKAMAGVKR